MCHQYQLACAEVLAHRIGHSGEVAGLAGGCIWAAGRLVQAASAQGSGLPWPWSSSRCGRVVPQDSNLSRRALLEAFEDLHRRGLARAVRTEEGEDLSRRTSRSMPATGLVAAVALNQPADADHRLGRSRAGGCVGYAYSSLMLFISLLRPGGCGAAGLGLRVSVRSRSSCGWSRWLGG